MMNSLTKQQCKWPDSARPGVPLHPEKDGWHWLSGGRFGELPTPYLWSVGWGKAGKWVSEPDDNMTYLGPVLKPDEAVTALLREVQLKAALREMVYEATHLSPQEDDGSHWAKISKRTLNKARAALKDEPFP